MPSDHNINIDPESRALQYRIEEQDGVWYLRREYPDMPRTPDEHYAMAHIRALMPSTAAGHIVVREPVRDRLEAEPGDVVSIITVASAHAQVIADAAKTVFQPVVEALNRIADEFVSELRSAMVETLTADQGDDEDSRLPEKFQEARERRERQREVQRHEANAHYPTTEENHD